MQVAGNFGEPREERLDGHRPRRRAATSFQIAGQTDVHAALAPYRMEGITSMVTIRRRAVGSTPRSRSTAEEIHVTGSRRSARAGDASWASTKNVPTAARHYHGTAARGCISLRTPHRLL